MTDIVEFFSNGLRLLLYLLPQYNAGIVADIVHSPPRRGGADWSEICRHRNKIYG
jgi:hypothetical protein